MVLRIAHRGNVTSSALVWIGIASSSLIPPIVTALVYAFSESHNVGDTPEYTDMALNFKFSSMEFGHLLWAPLGWLGHATLGLDYFGVAQLYKSVSILAAIAVAVVMRRLLVRIGVGPMTANAGAIGIALTQGVLNFGLAGTSYITGLAFLTLSLLLSVEVALCTRLRPIMVVGAAGALAFSVAFWSPFVLAAPAVVLTPLVLSGFAAFARTVAIGCLAVAFMALLFGIAAAGSGVRDFAGLLKWISGSMREYDSFGFDYRSVARTVFGIVRSFISMGDTGLDFKRYLLADPYNRVSLYQLVSTSLAKIALFGAVLVTVAFSLRRTPRGRRIGLLASLAALPLVLFGLYWHGGDLERYLPVFPFAVAAIAVAWQTATSRLTQGIIASFVVLAIVSNLASYARWEVGRVKQPMQDRVLSLISASIKPHSVVVVVRDPLELIVRENLLDRRAAKLHLVDPARSGYSHTSSWQSNFSRHAAKAWSAGGEVWISKRLLEAAPRRDSKWAEGDDWRIHWRQIPEFFGALAIDNDIGGPDGFLKVVRTGEYETSLPALVKSP